MRELNTAPPSRKGAIIRAVYHVRERRCIVYNVYQPDASSPFTFAGDMIGTFMAWLDHTEAGGSTAFCMNGYERVMTPEKGAAAFWYDLETNGLRDHNTRHGGCPIIKGSKWILNKWMYAYDNFAKFPCDTKPKTKIKEPDSSHYFK